MSTTTEAVTLPTTPAEPPAATIAIDRQRSITWQILVLAVPIIIGRIGWMGMNIVDTMMVGQFDTRELAYQSLAGNFVGAMFVPMMGLMLGTLIFVSNANGAKRHEECGIVWRRSQPYAFWLGVGMAVACLFGEPLLILLGQKPEIAAGAGGVLQVYALAMPIALVQLSGIYFLEGIKRPVPAMCIVLGANLFNVLGNWIFVWGNLGLPAMGAEGSAWATNICRMFMTLATFAVIWFMADRDAYGVRRKVIQKWRDWAAQRQVGYAAGASYAIENTAFIALTIFAGWLGAVSLAGMAITFQIFATHFMVAAGLASATSVLVGSAWGQGDQLLMRRIGLTGFALASGFLLIAIVNMSFGADLYARLFSDDPMVIVLVASVLPLAAFGLLFDGQQTVMANALRARRDNWFATISHTVAYILIMVPLALVFAFPMDLGVAGLYGAVLIASVISAISLLMRFLWLARKDLPAVPDGRNEE